jgi:hypothetical protein
MCLHNTVMIVTLQELDFSKIPLKLRSTSLAIVGIIQQTKTNALWKVLFDSRSDKTIVKRLSLPSGIETSTGKKRKILGMNASSTIDQDVLLKDITLPKFPRSIFQVLFMP